MDSFVSAFPWDLLEGGPEAALDRLGGEVGVSGISVWVGVPPVHAVCLHGQGAGISKSDGGLFFLPSDDAYRGTRLRPILGHFSKSRCPLRAIQNSCRERGLAVRAVVSAARTGLIARRHEEFACKNVFGQPSLSTICLQNPDVQHYLIGLVGDMASNAEVRSVVLRDWWIGWAEAFDGSLTSARELGEIEKQLLGICFCESCFQKAEAEAAEPDTAHRHAKSLLNRLLMAAEPPTMSWKSIAAEYPALSAYCDVQRRSLAVLFQRIADGAGCQVLVDAEVPLSTMAVFEGREYSEALVRHVLSREVLSVLGKTRTNAGQNLHFPANYVISQGSDLVSQISHVATMGVASIELDNYSMLPESTLTILKQAIRFARRQA